MRIGIDVRYLSHGLMGGVHTYAKHFVPSVVDLAREHQVYLYADTKRPFELDSLPSHVAVRYLPWSSPLSSVYHDFFMRRQMAADQLDVVHFPANYGFGPRGARTVITLHDALNILPMRENLRGQVKTPRSVVMSFYLHYCTQLALRGADLLMTDSQHAKTEITRYSTFEPEWIVPIAIAPTPDLRRIDDASVLNEVRQRYGLERPFILADALKNPAVIVRAWRRLPGEVRDSRQIVFFSRTPYPREIVHDAVSSGHARLLVRPSRGDLIALYSMAEAFVFPSWIEGFGLPVLEAMTCGAPVIASDRGSIPEVAGDAAVLVDAEDEDMLARQIQLVLETPGVASRLRAQGLARAQQFSWRNTAQQILASYETVVRQKAPATGRPRHTR
jgi:glycosyltransferase involved in cell wall biosynthesis